MIRVGIGGWNYEPWRGTFYPPGLTQKKELEYASRKLTSIEINGTYYGSQKPESFARWRNETPDDFVFSVKGPRFATNRGVLAEAGASIERFFGSGVMELREKLGPINWQFLPAKKFASEDFEAFLRLLPKQVEGRSIRHVVEVRHHSFNVPEFAELLHRYEVATVIADSESFPLIADLTAPFVYARLQRASKAIETGYSSEDLQSWASRAKQWSDGKYPADLAWTGDRSKHNASPRDVFIYMINGDKTMAPAAAMALIERLNSAV